MPRKQRYLITTADERTWKFDRPVIFLGEWCRIYDRKHIWQGMDAIVAAPYGLTQSKKDADNASHTGPRRRPHPASHRPTVQPPSKTANRSWIRSSRYQERRQLSRHREPNGMNP